MTALAALNRAREAWARTSMQLSIDHEYDRSLCEVAPTPIPGASPGATSQSARAFTSGAEPGRVPPPRAGQPHPPVRDTAAPTGASAPPTPAPNGPGRNTPKVSRGQGQEGA